MAKLLDVIAEQLKVRRLGGDTSEEVSEQVRKIFKKEFNHHLYRKLKTINVGEHIDYMYDCGKERPLSVLNDNANLNLAEVLKKLPELPEGEYYAFPPNSYISFTLTEKFSRQCKVKISVVSEVFVKAGL